MEWELLFTREGSEPETVHQGNSSTLLKLKERCEMCYIEYVVSQSFSVTLYVFHRLVTFLCNVQCWEGVGGGITMIVPQVQPHSPAEGKCNLYSQMSMNQQEALYQHSRIRVIFQLYGISQHMNEMFY